MVLSDVFSKLYNAKSEAEAVIFDSQEKLIAL
jgi:hypothetical protein